MRAAIAAVLLCALGVQAVPRVVVVSVGGSGDLLSDVAQEGGMVSVNSTDASAGVNGLWNTAAGYGLNVQVVSWPGESGTGGATEAVTAAETADLTMVETTDAAGLVAAMNVSTHNLVLLASDAVVAIGPWFRQNKTARATIETTDLSPMMYKLLRLPIPDDLSLSPLSDIFKSRLETRAYMNRSTKMWHTATDRITIYPNEGPVAAGLRFDVAVLIPKDLPGVDAQGDANITITDGVCPSDPVKQDQNTHWLWLARNCSVTGNSELKVGSGMREQQSKWTVKSLNAAGAKNVLLFVGDGMSLPMLTATRILKREDLPVDKFPYTGMVHTQSLNSIIPDSAATASAFNAGHKTINGAMGVYPDAEQHTGSNSWEADTDEPRFETMAEYFRRAHGMRVGAVSTASICDATPAAVWSHVFTRSKQTQIAHQGLDVMDVLLGGGMRNFNGDKSKSHGYPEEFKVLPLYQDSGYHFVDNTSALHEARQNPPEKLLGLFADYHMDVIVDRNETEQPGLQDMTLTALEVLHRRPEDRFFLQVEAAWIDKHSHNTDTGRFLAETVELMNTIDDAKEWLRQKGLLEDTLIVVTSDHATGGFDVHGTVDTDIPSERVNEAIKIYEAAEWPDWVVDPETRRVKNWLTAEYTLAGNHQNHPNYREDYKFKNVGPGWIRDERKESLKGIEFPNNVAGSSSAVHTASDVMVFADGPGADYFRGGMHQSLLFFGMAGATEPKARSSQSMNSNNNINNTPCDDDSLSAEAILIIVFGSLILIAIIGAAYFIRSRATAHHTMNEPTV